MRGIGRIVTVEHVISAVIEGDFSGLLVRECPNCCFGDACILGFIRYVLVVWFSVRLGYIGSFNAPENGGRLGLRCFPFIFAFRLSSQ